MMPFYSPLKISFLFKNSFDENFAQMSSCERLAYVISTSHKENLASLLIFFPGDAQLLNKKREASLCLLETHKNIMLYKLKNSAKISEGPIIRPITNFEILRAQEQIADAHLNGTTEILLNNVPPRLQPLYNRLNEDYINFEIWHLRHVQ